MGKLNDWVSIVCDLMCVYASVLNGVLCHHCMARPQVADGGDGLQ
jgi:hypothetical protein